MPGLAATVAEREFHRHFGFTLTAPHTRVYLLNLGLWSAAGDRPLRPVLDPLRQGSDINEFNEAMAWAASLPAGQPVPSDLTATAIRAAPLRRAQRRAEQRRFLLLPAQFAAGNLPWPT